MLIMRMSVWQRGAGETYLVSTTHVLAELMPGSDTELAADDLVEPPAL